MKVNPSDMDDIRSILHMYDPFAPDVARENDIRDIALARILCRLWDRGYWEGLRDGRNGG